MPRYRIVARVWEAIKAERTAFRSAVQKTPPTRPTTHAPDKPYDDENTKVCTPNAPYVSRRSDGVLGRRAAQPTRQRTAVRSTASLRTCRSSSSSASVAAYGHRAAASAASASSMSTSAAAAAAAAGGGCCPSGGVPPPTVTTATGGALGEGEVPGVAEAPAAVMVSCDAAMEGAGLAPCDVSCACRVHRELEHV